MNPVATGLYVFAVLLTGLYSIRLVAMAIRHQNQNNINNNYVIEGHAFRIFVIIVLAVLADLFL